jgi:hypothetical protein
VESRPLGPWVGPDGEEILDDLPYRIYTAGVVYPVGMRLTNRIEIVEKGDVDEEFTKDREPAIADNAPDAADDDESVDEALETGRSTLSFTVRVPRTVGTVDLILDFGSYHPINVAGIAEQWWHRQSHQLTAVLSLTGGESTHTFIDGQHKIVVGVHARPGQSDDALATLWMRNESSYDDDSSQVTATLFQTRLSARFKQLLPYLPSAQTQIDEVDLLYRDVETFAIGHGTDVAVSGSDSGVTVTTIPMPVVRVPALTPDIKSSDGTPYALDMDGLAEFNESATAAVDLLISDYKVWVDELRSQMGGINSRFSALAIDNVSACERFLADIADGWKLVQTDALVREVFSDMSRAMGMQRRAYSAETRSMTPDESGAQLKVSAPNPHSRGTRGGTWRPFQIAFILANIRRVVNEDDRLLDVDLIWMPTGGGKTEAYLGLSAFVILWSRRNDPTGVGSKPSTKILMRYTYRLLTVQQLVRAAALICALERLRDASPDRYGTSEVRIGCWLGNTTTPGTAEQAAIEVSAWEKQGKDLERGPFILTRCPWCGCEMGQKWGRGVLGYRKVTKAGKRRVLVHCPADDCEFGYRNSVVDGKKKDRGIPLLYCDEEVYKYPPDFVVGTIDKVAMMAWKTESGQLFGIKNGVRVAPPPSLLIQDELHLITGSLGSLDAMYEASLEALCLHDGGRRPLIVASSATTRNYKSQIQSLYGRSSRIVPPLGLGISDSFFAVRDDSLPGKTYVAVAASGFMSAANLQTKVAAVLAHFVPVIDDSRWDIDPYWTNVLFFSSRRSLARMMTTVEDSLRLVMRAVRRASGLSSGKKKEGSREAVRSAYRRLQITATSSDDVNKALEQLGQRMPLADAVDICYATSMIEVGLDVPRLGLMSVMGQPKSSSQYIQVTGRVGRGSASPALITVVLNHTNVRDLSHFETFSMFHERLYASVEPASVTPFTYQALSRTARGCVAVFGRISLGHGSSPGSAMPAADALKDFVVSSRSPSVDESATITQVFNEITSELTNTAVGKLKWSDSKSSSLLLGFGEVEPPGRLEPVWRVMRSMRSVDSDALARVVAQAEPNHQSDPTQAATVETDGEDL